MNSEIISVGTELLLGHVINTNAAFLSRKLASAGIGVYFHSVVGDNHVRLTRALSKALQRSDIVFLTGGLGPTVDDITVESVASFLGRKRVFSRKAFTAISAYLKKRGIFPIPDRARKQAMIPEGAVCLKNETGTASGLFITHKKKIIILMPGPPGELEPMVVNQVIPYLKRVGVCGKAVIVTKTLKMIGLPESEVNEKVKDLLSASGDTQMGIYMQPGIVELKITSKAGNKSEAMRGISVFEKKVRERMGARIFGVDDETPGDFIGKLLRAKGISVAVAESCTGGLLAKMITDTPGSSGYFFGGVVAYKNYVKTGILKVKKEVIKKYGAVSAETSRAMSVGVAKLMKSDVGIGITGIAGPGGGSPVKPVGLVYVSVHFRGKVHTVKLILSGARHDVRLKAALSAIDLTGRVVEGRDV